MCMTKSMSDQSSDTPKTKEGISGWLNATGNLASLVPEEQRPQLITLVLIYIAFLILLLFAKLSDGIKVLLFVATSVSLLWLAFSVLPKQTKDSQRATNQLQARDDEIESLQGSKATLVEQVNASQKSLVDTITSARSYLDHIENELSTVEKHTQEDNTRNQLIELGQYIRVKKREFNSAVQRVKSGGQMIKTKKSAAASMADGFSETDLDENRESEPISSDTLA